MVELLCPHCEEEIELPDDASGLFECPFCNGEFEWNVKGEDDAVTLTEPQVGTAREKQFSFKGKPVHLVEWLSHSFSIMTLLLLIVCFSSTWYTISVVGEGEISVSMGLSDAELTEGNVAEKITFDESVDELQALYNRMCVEESDYDCYEVLEELEYWKSWKNAGSLLNVILICCTLAAVASVLSRIVLILTNWEVVEIPDTPYIVSELIRKFAPFVISGLLFVGTIIYMIINPGTAMLESPGITLESSFGAIVWISLAVPILTTILTFYEIEFMP